MNKKLISLAVAAALVAPAAAMAEATLYGKLNVALDYVQVDNVILPTYNVTNLPEVWGFVRNPVNDTLVLTRNPGRGAVGTFIVPPGGQITQGTDYDGWGMSAGGGNNYIPVNAPTTGAGGGQSSRLGVKGSEDLGGGLKAVYQIEFGINLDTNNNVASNSDTISMRNTFVGLAGGWGTFLMGRHDTPLKISTAKLDLFADTLADYNTTIGFNDIRADAAVAYISPSFAGFTFAGALVPTGGSNALGSLNTESNNISEGWSLAGIYSNGPFYASVAYESLGYNLFNSNSNNTECGLAATNCTNSTHDWNKWRVGLGLLDWNGFSLTAIYENEDGIAGSDPFRQGTVLVGGAIPVNWVLPGNPNKADLWQLQAAYAFGNNTIKAMYGQVGFNSDSYAPNPTSNATVLRQLDDFYNGNRSAWAVGYDYNFSKRTKVYALYTAVSDDRKETVAGSQWDGFSLGMSHSF